MEITDKLKEIKHLRRKLGEYEDALETVSRLENDPQLQAFLRKPSPVDSGRAALASGESLAEEATDNIVVEKPTDEEQAYYGGTDQETLLKVAYEFADGGEVDAARLLALAQNAVPSLTAQKELDEKKVNDHLNRAYNSDEDVGGFRVERVKEGKRGRGGHPASYRVVRAVPKGASDLFG